jgi:hypothetical protein
MERATYTTKSFIVALALVKRHLTADQAAEAAQVEVNSQIERWGEVEDCESSFFEAHRGRSVPSGPIARSICPFSLSGADLLSMHSSRCGLPRCSAATRQCSLSTVEHLAYYGINIGPITSHFSDMPGTYSGASHFDHDHAPSRR